MGGIGCTFKKGEVRTAWAKILSNPLLRYRGKERNESYFIRCRNSLHRIILADINNTTSVLLTEYAFGNKSQYNKYNFKN